MNKPKKNNRYNKRWLSMRLTTFYHFMYNTTNSIPRKAAIDYIKPLTTTLARIMPATGGTKDTLPGV